MAGESPHKISGIRGPDFDGPISRRRNDIFFVKIDNVNCRTVPNQNFSHVDFYKDNGF